MYMCVCVHQFAPDYLNISARVLPFVSQLCVSMYKCATVKPSVLVWVSAAAYMPTKPVSGPYDEDWCDKE